MSKEIKKPDHVSSEIWRQHLDWFNVLTEGQLTKDPTLKSDRSVHTKQHVKVPS